MRLKKYAPARSCCGSHCGHRGNFRPAGLCKDVDISEGSITVEADGEEDGKSYNKVTQGDKETVRDTDTVITGKSESNTVTIKSGGQTSDVTLKDVSIKSDKDAALKVEGDGNGGWSWTETMS